MQFFRFLTGISLILFLPVAGAFAQLPTFSGFWLTPQLTAPTAMAGSDDYRVTAHYRRQGFEENSGYLTYLLSGQFPLYNRVNTHLGTLGVNVIRDETGSSFLLATSGLMLTYLYDARIARRHHLVAGAQGAYYWRSIDWSNVTTNNQFVNGNFDPAISPGERFSDDPSQAFLTNVGLAYYLADFEGDPIFHVGAAFSNANSGSFTYLLEPEGQSIPRSWLGYAHIRLLSNPYYDLVSDLYLRKENQVKDVVGGFRLRKGTSARTKIVDSHLGVGLYYSQDHTGILALQMIQPNWIIGISYDMVFGNQPLRNMQNAVEVTLGWRAIRGNNGPRYHPSKQRRKLPWRNKRRLPWQGR